MDRLNQAREALKQIFADHQALEARGCPDSVRTHYIEDDHRGEYLIIHSGYSAQTQRRVYGVVFHVWFADGKIWVERDNVIPSITGEMVARGVASEWFASEPYRQPVPEPA